MPELTLGEAAEAEGRGGGAGGSGGGGGDAGGGCSFGAPRGDAACPTSKRTWPRHGDTADLHSVADELGSRFPDAPLLAVGFSAGSNVLVKYLGEAGGGSPFAGAVSVCNAYDLVAGTRLFCRLHPLWDRYMARLLRVLARRHSDMLEQVAPHISMRLVRKASSVRALDALVAAPLYGYPSVDAYYADSHCCTLLEHVRVPTLLLNARDDPVIHPSLLEYPINAAATNPALIAAITKRGGHLGWITGWAPSSWYEAAIFEYLGAVVDAHQASNVHTPAASQHDHGAAGGGACEACGFAGGTGGGGAESGGAGGTGGGGGGAQREGDPGLEAVVARARRRARGASPAGGGGGVQRRRGSGGGGGGGAAGAGASASPTRMATRTRRARG